MVLYVLTDGMCESPGRNTSLDAACHKNLDRLASTGEAGFYEPATRPFVESPETYVVFPYFFGLRPDANPGRAGLELVASGEDLAAFPCSAVARIVPSGYDVRLGWSGAPPLDHAEPLAECVASVTAEFSGVRVLRSPVSKRGNVWCAAARTRDELESYLCVLQCELLKEGLAVYHHLDQEYNGGVGVHEQAAVFYGWSIGSLLGGLMLAGVQVSQSDDVNPALDVGRLDKKARQFRERILPLLVRRRCESLSTIVYFKEPSSLAREGSKRAKVEAIECIDGLLGLVIEELGGRDVKVVLLCDHQSNLGEETTLPGPTLYCYANLQRMGTCSSRFTEKDVLARRPLVRTQADLLRALSAFVREGECSGHTLGSGS